MLGGKLPDGRLLGGKLSESFPPSRRESGKSRFPLGNSSLFSYNVLGESICVGRTNRNPHIQYPSEQLFASLGNRKGSTCFGRSLLGCDSFLLGKRHVDAITFTMRNAVFLGNRVFSLPERSGVLSRHSRISPTAIHLVKASRAIFPLGKPSPRGTGAARHGKESHGFPIYIYHAKTYLSLGAASKASYDQKCT